MKYKPWIYNPYGEDGKAPCIIYAEFEGAKYFLAEDTLVGNTLIMAHWELMENKEEQ